MKESSIILCKEAEILEGQTKEFCIDAGTQTWEIFIAKKNGKLFGYLNSCPHTGAPLNWLPDQFLNLTGHFIQCALHGAQFLIEDGRCISGPCTGQYLTPVSLNSEGGIISLNTANQDEELKLRI